MRRFLTLIIAVAVFVATPVFAPENILPKNSPTNYQGYLGQAVTEQMKWFASGALLGSNVTVDTLVAGTLNDTTYAIDIGGATTVVVTVLSRSKNDQTAFTMYAQVGHTDSVAGPWHTLQATYAVANTAGAQVGGTADTGRDTTAWILSSAIHALIDTTAALAGASGATGITWTQYAERALVAGQRNLRLWVDPTAAAGDTMYIAAYVTRIYPR